jgi:hypothetical protein
MASLRAPAGIPDPSTESVSLSRVRNIHCKLVSCSAQCADAPAAALLEINRDRHWQTAIFDREENVVLELHEAALVFALKIDNRNTKCLEVDVGLKNTKSGMSTPGR